MYYNNTSIDINFNISYNLSDDIINSTERSPRWALIGLSVIPAWILFGNLMVLLAVLLQKNLRTLSNWVIASLAFTDFLLALIVVPLGTYQTVNGKWELGLITCLVWTGSDVFLSTTSILHLCAIAINRWVGISYPLHIRTTSSMRHVIALLVPTWTISIAISLPLIVQGIRDHEHVLIISHELGPQCGIFDQTFAVYSSLVSFFLPLLIMIMADFRSVQILRNTSKVAIRAPHILQPSRSISRSMVSKDHSAYELAESETTSTVQTPMIEYRSAVQSPIMEYHNTVSPPGEPDMVILTPPPSVDFERDDDGESRNSRTPTKPPITRSRSKSVNYINILATRGMIKLNSRERRAEKTLIWVFVCFVAFWLPFFCTNLTYGLCQSCNIPPDLFLSFTWLGYISSGVNPCIYTFLNKDFRNAFRKILLCKPKELMRKPTT